MSVVVWYISRIVQALIGFTISLYSSSVAETGYPIALNIDKTNIAFYIFCTINIVIWFVILFGIWKLIKKLLKK